MRHLQQSRRARRALVWGLAAFVVLQLGLTLVMEFALPQLRDPYYGAKSAILHRRLREAGLEGGSRTVANEARRARLVVMVGSSRVAEGLRAAVAEGELAEALGQPVVFFNLGIHGDGPLSELLNLERLTAEGVKPDLLLVEVLPSFLTEQAVNLHAAIPAERMGMRERALLSGYGLPVEELPRSTWQCWAAPWYAHRLSLLSAVCPELLPSWLRQDWNRGCDDCGWRPCACDLTPAGRRRALDVALGGNRPLLQYRLGGPFCPALKHLLEKCRRASIPTALVLMPEGPLFQGMYSKDAWPQIDGFLKELTGPHGTPVLNARDWIREEEFIDSHHLLPDGAARFTRRLAREAILPLLRQPNPHEPLTPYPSPRSPL